MNKTKTFEKGKYKLIALDMDGTVLNNEGQISSENQKWIEIAIEQGIIVMFVTGRGMPNIKPFIDQLDLRAPIISTNGGEVWASPAVLYRRRLLDHQIIMDLRRLALQEDIPYWAYTTAEMLKSNKWINPDDASKMEWLKFGYLPKDDECLLRIKSELNRWGNVEVTSSNPRNLEVNAKGVSKLSGLYDICELLNINMSQVVAIGDGMNDATMIAEAGLGVAMDNAEESLKRIADVVTVTNELNGVACVIQEYVLNCK